MSSIQALERQVAELRALIRQRAGAPTEMLVVVRGDQSDESAERSTLDRVPAAWRDEVRLKWVRLPWLKGRNIYAGRTEAVQESQTIDFIASTPALLGKGSVKSATPLVPETARPARSRRGGKPAAVGDRPDPLPGSNPERARVG